jgi:hypothetical protein
MPKSCVIGGYVVFLRRKLLGMNKWVPRILSVLLVIAFAVNDASAQCSICTKTASQLGKASAEGLNSGIVYLMLAPFAIGGYIAYRWWQQEKGSEK